MQGCFAAVASMVWPTPCERQTLCAVAMLAT
nr:MAG TPA: hypothetical protein [Caudoviricetes sp.]